MDTLDQKALDYTLGVLPKEESLLFEAMLEENEDARASLAHAQEDCANLALSTKPKSLGQEVKQRILENCLPKLNFDPLSLNSGYVIIYKCAISPSCSSACSCVSLAKPKYKAANIVKMYACNNATNISINEMANANPKDKVPPIQFWKM